LSLNVCSISTVPRPQQLKLGNKASLEPAPQSCQLPCRRCGGVYCWKWTFLATC